MEQIEQWKLISRFPEFEVSDFGNVRKRGATENLRPWQNPKTGLVTLRLCRKLPSIKSLVAVAFLPGTPDGTYQTDIKHIDGDPKNNRADNLSITHVSEAHRDRMRRLYREEKCRNQKLNPYRVRMIRRYLQLGDSCREIANKFNVCTSTIEKVATGEYWSHVE